ncbi:MAG TPA: efflux RND transporter periplasmic adaptor subunit [Candidatus Competibacteraceae bacterium]|nr:efflux RND transporter periplasmic adaptor subunit [Candidatus Competibacteraceae bacterium]
MRGKSLVALILLAALGAGGYYYWHSERPSADTAAPGAAAAAPGKPPGAMAMPVEARPVRRGTVLRAVEAVGTLRANEAVVVRPELGGRIAAILFQEGQVVRQGEPLVRLESSVYQAELDQARARLNLSRVNYQRQQSLDRRGLASEQERDKARSEMEADEAALALAQARLAKMTVVAPFDGMLGLRLVSMGDYVSPGQDLVNLLDLDPIKVDFRVPEVFLAELRPGQAIEVRVDAFPGQSFEGEVYAIDPQVDVNGRSLLLRARIPNADGRLRAGLFARVNLILERRADALLIPESALVPQGDKQFVYRVVDGKALFTEVAAGRRQGAEVEITSGLSAGDQVVTAGQLKIRDGMPVAPLPAKEG